MVDKHFAKHLRTVLAMPLDKHPTISAGDFVALTHTIVTGWVSLDGERVGITPPMLVRAGQRLPRRVVLGFELAERMLDTAREVLA